jgi:hypothetical protein
VPAMSGKRGGRERLVSSFACLPEVRLSSTLLAKIMWPRQDLVMPSLGRTSEPARTPPPYLRKPFFPGLQTDFPPPTSRNCVHGGNETLPFAPMRPSPLLRFDFRLAALCSGRAFPLAERDAGWNPREVEGRPSRCGLASPSDKSTGGRVGTFERRSRGRPMEGRGREGEQREGGTLGQRMRGGGGNREDRVCNVCAHRKGPRGRNAKQTTRVGLSVPQLGVA